MIPRRRRERNLPVNQTHNDLGCAPHMQDRKKCKNGGHRPSMMNA
jgi:hypothetical protein